MTDREWGLLGIGAVILAGIAALVVGGAWGSWWLADQFLGAPDVPPLARESIVDVATGDRAWPIQATIVAVVLLVVVTVVVTVGVSRAMARRGRRGSVRFQARFLTPDPAGLRRYLNGTGPVIGPLLHHRRAVVRMTTEDTALMIAGPRSGKTSAFAVPAIVGHDGPVLTTSNKRDIWDHVATARGQVGHVWCFDPLRIVGEPPAMWWNPLAHCGTLSGAERMVSIWADSRRDTNATKDAHFDLSGENLLAWLLLAAALGGESIATLSRWLASPGDQSDPLDILGRHPDYRLVAASLEALSQVQPKQRDGYFSVAQQHVSWLVDPAVRQWVEPGPGRREFRPADLATGTDTLVSLSSDGRGAAVPLVASLTAMTLDAAMEEGNAHGGRLPTPMLAVLDEVANVVRWQELPDLYSHFGSRGIMAMSFVQSHSQLQQAYGREGADKLTSATNLLIYGGGTREIDFLEQISKMSGSYDLDRESVSVQDSRHGASRSRSRSREKREVFTIDALQALEHDLAVVIPAETRMVVVEKQFWFNDKALKAKIEQEPPVEAPDLVATSPVAPR